MADSENCCNVPQLTEWRGYSEYLVKEYSNDNCIEVFRFAIGQLTEGIEEKKLISKKGNINYLNLPFSFDIETSSFVSYDEKGNIIKHATMYIWQFGINGSIIYGRTWEEFGNMLMLLQNYTNADEKNRIVIYVHNLGYEFGFISKWFEWDKVFSIKQRRPVQAIAQCFEFRCSLLLTNAALKYVGDNMLYKYPCKKLVGNLDYKKLRGSWTQLTDEELQYCIEDVRVVMCLIQQRIEEDGGIGKIPLTSTGYIRNFVRKQCFYGNSNDIKAIAKRSVEYHRFMKSLTINSEEEYYQMLRCFMGGFTHAGVLHANKVLKNIGSADLASSYPYHMLAEYYPMTRFKYIGNVESDEDFSWYLSNYCCMFDVGFLNIRPAVIFENPLSVSRCDIPKGTKYRANNGRLIDGEGWIFTSLTELDWDTISKFYIWDEIEVMNLRVSNRDYLPKAIIESILELYEKKTKLKGIKGQEQAYMMSKNLLNSTFGMMVTAAVRDELVFNEEWQKIAADSLSQLNSYNESYSRFLFYPWGVWVTAHARHSLFKAIYEFGEDYVYADTDSIKGYNFNEHEMFFKRYNCEVLMKLVKMCKHYDIELSKCEPIDKNGNKHLIGVWEIEKKYKRFKTCGAKRYMYEYDDGTLSLTVSGLNKKMAIPWLLQKYESNAMCFEIFGENMFIPAGHTGKMTLTYIDKEDEGSFIDYMGNEGEYHELTSIYMEEQSYHMSIVEDYLNYIEGVRYIEC